MNISEKLKRIDELRKLTGITNRDKWSQELDQLIKEITPSIFQLSPHQARVMFKRYIEGKSRREIAKEIYSTSQEWKQAPPSYFESKIDSTIYKAKQNLKNIKDSSGQIKKG